jgi:hypothetical protein
MGANKLLDNKLVLAGYLTTLNDELERISNELDVA